MDALLTGIILFVIAFVILLALVGLAAAELGFDSRPGFDQARPEG